MAKKSALRPNRPLKHGCRIVCTIALLLICATFPVGQLLAADNATPLLAKITVPDDHGRHVHKANIFIGDAAENTTYPIRYFASFNKDTYGDNYYADYNQQAAIKAQIAQLPEDMPINLIGHGLGASAAAQIAVGLANTRRINILVTIAPRGNHPDFSILKNSVNKWVDVDSEGNKS